MSGLDWFITRSNLPDILKEVLYDLVANIDIEIEAELDEVSGGFKDRIQAIENSLDDGTGGDSLIDVCILSNEVDDLIKRVVELEEPEDPEEEAMEEEAKEEPVKPLEIKPLIGVEGTMPVKEVKLVGSKEKIKCPYCGGTFEAGK